LPPGKACEIASLGTTDSLKAQRKDTKLLQSWCAAPILSAVSNHTASTTWFLQGYGKEVPVGTIHVYRAAREYFIDGIYWGDEAEGVRFYLAVTGVPHDQITQALAQVAQEGTSIIHQQAGTGLVTEAG
jgi:hypothetical protein